MPLIRPVQTIEEVHDAYQIEAASYTPDAAASLEAFEWRFRTFGEFFLAAFDERRSIVGVVNGVRSDMEDLADEGMKRPGGVEAAGRNFCILTVVTKAEARGRGIGSALVRELLGAAERHGIEAVLLMCEEELIPFYRKLGFQYIAPSRSEHGGIRWHEMKLRL